MRGAHDYLTARVYRVLRALCVPVVFIIGAMLWGCGPSERIVTVQRVSASRPVTGRLMAVYGRSVIVDTAAELVSYLTLKPKRPEYEALRREAWKSLAASSIRIPCDSIRTLLLDARSGVGDGILLGLGFGLAASAMLAIQDAKAHSLPDDPGERFLLGLKTVGVPAVVCGYLLGLLHSDWERVCIPSEPDFENTIRNASYFGRDIPLELTLWK